MKTAWISIVSAVALVSQTASGPQPISLTLREGTSMAAALSPDGRTLMIDLLGSLWTLPATGGAATRVTDEYLDARQPVWAPDNRRVAFQGYADGVWHLYVMNADGSGLRMVTSGPFDDREPSWSRDGSHLAFSSDRSGNYDIWDLDLAGGAVRQVTRNPANDYAPAYSPINSTIAFVTERPDRRGVWTIDAATGAEASLAAATGALSAPSWSADGAKVVYNVIAADRSESDRRRESDHRERRRLPVPRAMDLAVGAALHRRRQDQEAIDPGRHAHGHRIHRAGVVHANAVQADGP